MTVAKLREILDAHPDLMYVHIRQTDDTYASSPAQHASAETLEFTDGDLKALDTVLIITDEP